MVIVQDDAVRVVHYCIQSLLSPDGLEQRFELFIKGLLRLRALVEARAPPLGPQDLRLLEVQLDDAVHHGVLVALQLMQPWPLLHQSLN